MPVTGLSKTGTKQNSTIIVECCFFSTGLSSNSITESRTWGLRDSILFSIVTVFSQLFVPWFSLHGMCSDKVI